MTPTFLLTGFAPFDGQRMNPSWLAAQDAAAELVRLGFSAAAVELPCVFATAAGVLRSAIAERRPSIVLCVGQAGGRSRIGLERVAVNVQDARIPDNAGAQPIDTAVDADGPAAYFSTLPLKACLRALTEQDIPAEISQTAGTYVCNSLFYSLMDHLSTGQSGVRGGFIHIPLAPEQAGNEGVPALPIDVATKALIGIARTTAVTTADLKLGAGALS